MKAILGVAAAAVFGALLTGGLVARAQPAPTQAQGATPAKDGGTMGQFTGAGGDPVLGETLYQRKCASCHDNPTGRTPPKAAIAQNTPTLIISTLAEGGMRPMAAGMAPHVIASVAAYLSARKAGGLGAVAPEAPPCKDRPRFTLAGGGWNGWGNGETQSRFQPNPGLKAADVPRLKL